VRVSLGVNCICRESCATLSIRNCAMGDDYQCIRKTGQAGS
jgi:hypothetical protein